MDKNTILSLLDEKENEYLAHYGIKGQEWGKRRFQNEDGSLTPEGRIRYGLKPDYSNMTDKQLQEAITRKRTQNQYVDLMTAGSRKKQQELSGLISAVSSTSKTANTVLDKTVYNNLRKENQSEIDALEAENKKLKTDIKAAKAAGNSAERNRLQEKKEDNEDMIKGYKDAIKNVDNTKKSWDTIAGLPGENADKLAKIATKSELSEKTAEAYRNINEMDSDQLKKTVDRMLLEKQYDEIVNPPKPSRIERGREIFQMIGATLGIVVTALTIKKLLNDLKTGKAAQSDDSSDFLAHYGVKGMRKGERRYQNEDGSLTPEGYRHYGIDPNGRQDSIPDTRAVLNRQRAESKTKNQALKIQAKQRAYTQKIAQRQAIREARNRAQIQSIYNRQTLEARRREQEQELDIARRARNNENAAKAENRANLRKNIVKGVAAIAAIGSAVYIGRHILRESALNNAHMRDIQTINLTHKNEIERIKAETNKIRLTNIDIIKENNRVNEEKYKRRKELFKTIFSKKDKAMGEIKKDEPISKTINTIKTVNKKKKEKSGSKYTSIIPDIKILSSPKQNISGLLPSPNDPRFNTDILKGPIGKNSFIINNGADPEVRKKRRDLISKIFKKYGGK